LYAFPSCPCAHSSSLFLSSLPIPLVHFSLLFYPLFLSPSPLPPLLQQKLMSSQGHPYRRGTPYHTHHSYTLPHTPLLHTTTHHSYTHTHYHTHHTHTLPHTTLTHSHHTHPHTHHTPPTPSPTLLLHPTTTHHSYTHTHYHTHHSYTLPLSLTWTPPL